MSVLNKEKIIAMSFQNLLQDHLTNFSRPWHNTPLGKDSLKGKDLFTKGR